MSSLFVLSFIKTQRNILIARKILINQYISTLNRSSKSANLPYIDKSKKKPTTVKQIMASFDEKEKSKQIYEYLLVLDFEATCDNKNPPQPQVFHILFYLNFYMLDLIVFTQYYIKKYTYNLFWKKIMIY